MYDHGTSTAINTTKTLNQFIRTIMTGRRSLYRFSGQRGEGLRDDLMIAGAKESLRGLDVNRLIQQGLDQGVQSIDKGAVKQQLEKDFKKGVKRELKRKASNSLPGRAVKRVASLPRRTAKRVKDIFG